MSSEKIFFILLTVLAVISVVFFSWIGLVIGDIEILSYLEFGMLCTITIIIIRNQINKYKD